MQNAAVKFPYWENIARGWEDMKAMVLLFQFLFLMVPVIIITVFLVSKWRNRSFTWKDVGNFIIDSKDKAVRKIQGEKDKWEHF